MCLLSNHEDIIADKDDESQQSFVLLLKELVVIDSEAKDRLFKVILDYDSTYNIHSIMRNNRNHLTRGFYCDLMVALYEREHYKKIATISLIKGLEDQNQVIKKKLLEFWSDTSILSPNPSERLLEMMRFKSDFSDEKTWLQCTVWLLLDLIKLTRDTQEETVYHSFNRSPEKDVTMKTEFEESKEELKSSFQDGSFNQDSMQNQSFGQTLEMSSSLKNSKYYKSYQKESLLMSMQGVQKGSDLKNSKYTQKSSQDRSLGRSNTQNLDNSMGTISHDRGSKSRKMAKGIAKFFEKNEISRNVTTVGRNK